jgi:hypothetical protein
MHAASHRHIPPMSIRSILFFLLVAVLMDCAHAAKLSNPYDPCALVTLADLQATFGTVFKTTAHEDDSESRICQYESQVQHFVVSIYTNRQERQEFDANAKSAQTTPAQAQGLMAPGYSIPTFARLIVWKNQIAITVDASDITGEMTAEQLQAARVKLANIALRRVQ